MFWACSSPGFGGNDRFYFNAKREWCIAHTSGGRFSNNFIVDWSLLLGQRFAVNCFQTHGSANAFPKRNLLCGALQVHVKFTNYQNYHHRLFNRVHLLTWCILLDEYFVLFGCFRITSLANSSESHNEVTDFAQLPHPDAKFTPKQPNASFQGYSDYFQLQIFSCL